MFYVVFEKNASIFFFLSDTTYFREPNAILGEGGGVSSPLDRPCKK